MINPVKIVVCSLKSVKTTPRRPKQFPDHENTRESRLTSEVYTREWTLKIAMLLNIGKRLPGVQNDSPVMNTPGSLNSPVVNTLGSLSSPVVKTLRNLKFPVMNTRVSRFPGVLRTSTRTGLQKTFSDK